MSSIQLAIIFTLFVVVCGNPAFEIRSIWNSLSTEQQQQLKTVVNNPLLSKSQVEEKIEEFVNGLGDEKVKTAFSATKAKIEELKNRPPLSEDAKAVMKQIGEVYNDVYLSLKDTCKKANSILNGVNDALKLELKFLQPRDCNKGAFENLVPGQALPPFPSKA